MNCWSLISQGIFNQKDYCPLTFHRSFKNWVQVIQHIFLGIEPDLKYHKILTFTPTALFVEISVGGLAFRANLYPAIRKLERKLNRVLSPNKKQINNVDPYLDSRKLKMFSNYKDNISNYYIACCLRVVASKRRPNSPFIKSNKIENWKVIHSSVAEK